MKELVMIKVKSSQVNSIGYDVENKELYIEFTSGAVYKYSNVPKEIFNNLIGPVNSAGSYFHSHVRGKFDYKKTDLTVENLIINLV